MSPPTRSPTAAPPVGQRVTAALLGGVVCWRLGNAAGGVLLWLWLGAFLDGGFALFLVGVVVVPVVGAVAGDAALRRGVWSTASRAQARRAESTAAVAAGPALVGTAIHRVWATGSVLLHALVTLVVVAAVLGAEYRAGGPFLLAQGAD